MFDKLIDATLIIVVLLAIAFTANTMVMDSRQAAEGIACTMTRQC
jgi:hypothetical protein